MCNNSLMIDSREDNYFDKAELKREKAREDYIDDLIYEQKGEDNEDNE